MTIRQYVAMTYGLCAAAIAMCVLTAPGHANPDHEPRDIAEFTRQVVLGHHNNRTPAARYDVPLAEIEPNTTGHAEDDDLPAYLTGAPEESWDIAWAESAPLQANIASTESILAAYGPAGMSWNILLYVALLAATCLALVTLRRSRHA